MRPRPRRERAAPAGGRRCGKPSRGGFGGITAFLLSQILAHVDYGEEAITASSPQIDALLAPFRGAVDRVTTIPGVKQRTAEVVLAEIGVDMSVFPSAAHLASWAALCPGNNESAASSG